jgi:hypothetical protein
MGDGEARVVPFRASVEQWEGILEEYRASGKSIRGFCRDKGIPVSQMSYYLGRARKAARREKGFIELVRQAPAGIYVEAGSFRIHVARGFDAELLRQVAEALS